MRLAVLCVALCPVVALAEDGGNLETPKVTAKDAPVIGGAAAPAGKWPDAAAILWDGSQGCTGTLIAPTVVLTAGHCVAGGAPNGVLVGASALSRPGGEGEVISVQAAHDYPDSQNTVDAGILVLSKASVVTPRAIASGWARFDIKNNATVQLVGYGTIDRDARVGTDKLMEATTTITDFNCTTSSGCAPGARPDGELGAGGNGIDTCPGDSGGPLYLTTTYGDFVAGITSRGYDDNQYYCSEGGIYGRADKIMDWIEMVSGAVVAKGPTPSAPAITVTRGDGAITKIAHNDPKTAATVLDAHTYAITQVSEYATAKVREDGTVRVCAGQAVGTTEITVTVTDKADPTRTLAARIPITIQEGDAPDDCDVNDFDGDSGGCCDTRRSAGGSILLALAVLLVLRRRRK